MIFKLEDIKVIGDDLTTGYKLLDDLVYDIALGITGNQTLRDNSALSSSKSFSKKNKYKPRTNLHQIINDALEKSDYRSRYEWDGDREFISDGIEFKVLKFDITTSDTCFVEMDGKEVKMTKRQLREWYNGRDL